ncbi:hypothetical protein DAMA08_020060 [Martiniozyma asiatica (nom. inval.)]|nr:hypothetical protein DAMA08_020060 [Martiniozyma asiatica]
MEYHTLLDIVQPDSWLMMQPVSYNRKFIMPSPHNEEIGRHRKCSLCRLSLSFTKVTKLLPM